MYVCRGQLRFRARERSLPPGRAAPQPVEAHPDRRPRDRTHAVREEIPGVAVASMSGEVMN